jgi:membrane-associated phospholipid phosphatase
VRGTGHANPTSSPPVGVCPGGRAQRSTGHLLQLLVVLCVGAYVALFWSGYRAFVWKTALVPAFAIYGCATPHRRAFLVEWAPFIAGTIAFDFLRGGIYSFLVQPGFVPVQMTYAIELEQRLFNTPAAPLAFQPFRTALLDRVALFFHGSHFLFFLLFGLVVWHGRHAHFAHYRRALLSVMVVGLLGYAVVPTAPPWMAAALPEPLLPPVPHLVTQLYNYAIPELAQGFDTNPVAAMPSLHAAFPTSCALIAWNAFGLRIGIVVTLYAIGAMTSAMYLGEHYAVDVVAGAALAALAVALTAASPPPAHAAPGARLKKPVMTGFS